MRLVARLLAFGAGIWLMFAPTALGHESLPGSDNDRIIGPIAASLALVACWQVVAALRWATVPCGAWLVIAPLLVDYGDAASSLSAVAAGLVIVGTAPLGGGDPARFGGGWRAVGRRAWRTSADAAG